jgi:hypothetical protein
MEGIMTRFFWHFLFVYLLSSHLAPVMATVTDHHHILQKKCRDSGITTHGQYYGVQEDSLKSILKGQFGLESHNQKLAPFDLMIPKEKFLSSLEKTLKAGGTYQLTYFKNVLCSIEVQANGEKSLIDLF